MDQTNMSVETLPTGALGSGSMPAIFQPRLLEGRTLIDGGTWMNANLDSAVQQCMEIVDDYSDIIVDIALCDYFPLPAHEVSNNALVNWIHGYSIKSFYNGNNALFQQERAYPGLDLRHYFQELNDCPGAGGLSFDNSTTWCLQEAGRADAKAALEMG